jgi:CHAT domain-containing protein
VPCYERCLALRDRLIGPADPRTLLALQNLYSSRAHAGDANGSLTALRDLLDRLERHHPAQAATQTIRTEFAHQCMLLGRYAEALPAARASLAHVEKKQGASPGEVLVERFQLGHLLCRMLQYDEGMRLLDAVAAELPESGLTDGQLGYLFGTRATLALALGRADAQKLGEQALAYCDAEITDPSFASLATQLAVLFAPDERRVALARRALEACERLVGKSHQNTSSALANLAQVEVLAGELDQALEHARAAMPWFDRNPETMTPDRLTARKTLAICHLRRGEVDAAIPLLQQNLAELPRLLHACLPTLSDADRMDYAAGARVALDLLLTAAVRDNLDADVGLQATLAWKGVVAHGLFQELRWLRQQAGSGPELQAELAKLADTERSAMAAKLDAAAFAARRKTLDENLRELDRTRMAPTPESLRRALAADEVFVDYVVYDDWERDETRLCAFVVAGGKSQMVALGPVAPIQQALVAHQELSARAVQPAGPTASRLAEQAARRLTDLVWTPVARHVGDRVRVTLCLDGALATLPFATLRRADGTFLVEHHEFSHVASGAEMVTPATTAAASASPRLCAIADVDYGPLAAADASGLRRGFAPLAHSRREADTVIEAFRTVHANAAPPATLLGREATTQRFQAEATQATFLHIATHGFYSGPPTALAGGDPGRRRKFGMQARGTAMRRDPGQEPGHQAGLAFAAANGGADDGTLTANEIPWLDLHRCELVVLSACETGLGTPSAGDSLVGIRRALRLAGARRSLTTAWRIDDQATANLMATFYRELWQQRATPAAALRAAQRDRLAANRQQHGEPLVATWGAFLLEGR